MNEVMSEEPKGFAKYKKLIILLALLGVAMLIYVIVDNYEQRLISNSYNPVDLSNCSLKTLDDGMIELVTTSEYVYEATQEQLNETAKIQGYESLTLNEENKTVTYIMTSEKYDELITLLDTQSRAAVEALCKNTKYTALSSIEINEDFNEYTVRVATDGSGFKSNELIADLRSYSSMIDAFKGKTSSTIKVSIINVNDKVIATYDDTQSAASSEDN